MSLEIRQHEQSTGSHSGAWVLCIVYHWLSLTVWANSTCCKFSNIQFIKRWNRIKICIRDCFCVTIKFDDSVRLCKCVADSVRKNPLTSKSTDSEVEIRIKAWLRGAIDRKGGRTARAKKAVQKKKAASASSRSCQQESCSRSPSSPCSRRIRSPQRNDRRSSQQSLSPSPRQSWSSLRSIEG